MHQEETKNMLTDEIFQSIYGEQPLFLKWLLEDFYETIKEKEKIPNDLVIKREVPLLRTSKKQKQYRGDILVLLDDRYISLEVFTTLTKEGLTKSIAYMNRIYGTQMEKKEKKYQKLKKVTLLMIVEKVTTKIGKEWIQKYDLRNEKHELLNEAIEIYIIRLDKISVGGYNEGENNKLKKHILMMEAKTKKEREEFAKGSEKLMIIARYANNFIEDEVTSDFFSLESKKKDMYKEEGLMEGKKEGRKEGKKEEQRNIAMKMLKKSPISYISEITGLSEKEIKKLMKQE